MIDIIHACGSHARKHWKDIVEEPWRLTHKYQYCAIPKQEWREAGKKAVEIGRWIIANNSTGKFQYSQSNKRWNLYKNICRWQKKYGCTLYEAIRDCNDKNLQCDCSSFVLSLWWWATNGEIFGGRTWQTYTGGLRTVLRNTKAFDIYTATDATRTPALAVDGALYWKENAHVIMAALEKQIEPEPDDEPEKPLPDTEYTYFRVTGGTLRIRNKPSTLGKTVGFTNETEKYLLLDVTPNNWYQTDYKGQTAYVSGNTKYTEVINGG